MKLLEIKNLTTSFKIEEEFYPAVDNMSLDITKGEVTAIVGESGCGKSTLALSILGLHNPTATKVQGCINFSSQNLLQISESSLNKIRGNNISMIFQDPTSAFNPLIKIGAQIEEGLIYHTKLNRKERRQKVDETVKAVGLNVDIYHKLPHQLSGGMLQRAMIASALITAPDLLIADEPTTALDVTLQAQILDLLKDIQVTTDLSIILITHDLGVVAEIAHKVVVMYAGQIVELGMVDNILQNPKHPYTRSLLRAMPQSINEDTGRLYTIQGTPPTLKNMPRQGCRFAPRVPWVSMDKHEANPAYHGIEQGHYVLCTCHKEY